MYFRTGAVLLYSAASLSCNSLKARMLSESLVISFLLVVMAPLILRNPSLLCQGVYPSEISQPRFITSPRLSSTVLKPVDGTIEMFDTRFFV